MQAIAWGQGDPSSLDLGLALQGGERCAQARAGAWQDYFCRAKAALISCNCCGCRLLSQCGTLLSSAGLAGRREKWDPACRAGWVHGNGKLPAFWKPGLPLLQEEWMEKAARRYQPLSPWLPGLWGPACREERAGGQGLGLEFPGPAPRSEGWAVPGAPGRRREWPRAWPGPAHAPTLPPSHLSLLAGSGLTLLPEC